MPRLQRYVRIVFDPYPTFLLIDRGCCGLEQWLGLLSACQSISSCAITARFASGGPRPTDSLSVCMVPRRPQPLGYALLVKQR